MYRKCIVCFMLLISWASLVRGAHSDKYAYVDSMALVIPKEYTYSIDSLGIYINRNFSSQEERVRAIYIWMTHHLIYTVYNTFTSQNEEIDEKEELEAALRNRRGVCRQFARLFKALNEKVGITAYVIDGYNKNGSVIIPEIHEWCAARIDSQWYLFDPTFGMGYIDNYKFVSSPNLSFFMILPQKAISTHMPFDPIWQLMERPYSYPEFEQGVIDEQRMFPVFHWKDSITAYSEQSDVEQMRGTTARMLVNGNRNELVDYFLQLNQSNIYIIMEDKVMKAYNEATKLQNEAIDQINLFIHYRNMLFTPKKKEKEVRRMIEIPESIIHRADSLINTIHVLSRKHKNEVLNLRQAIIDASTQIYKQKLFVERYYTTKSSLRKQLFYR